MIVQPSGLRRELSDMVGLGEGGSASGFLQLSRTARLSNSLPHLRFARLFIIIITTVSLRSTGGGEFVIVVSFNSN